MTLLYLRHGTKKAHLASIMRDGIIPHQPYEDGNFPSYYALRNQPRGVYAHPLDGGSPCIWGDKIIVFAWCGPVGPDPEIEHATVIPQIVPPECIIGVLERQDFYTIPDAGAFECMDLIWDD